MALLIKPNMQQVWASGGDIVEPSDLKKQQGWTVEVPPHQFENWIQNRQDAYLAHINQRGIAAWDGLTNYLASGLSYVQGTDGKIYKSVAASGPASVVSNPTTDVTDTYWTIAFADVGAFLTQTTGDARYTQRANNLSDLTNTATARTNLGAAPLASPAFTGTPTTPTAATATNNTQIASTAFVKASIAADVPTASTTVAGLVELATNAEVIAGADTTRAVTPSGLQTALPRKSQCTAWVNFNGTGTVTIRDSYNVSSITDNGTGDYTINFASAMANANYAPMVSSSSGGDFPWDMFADAIAPTTSGFRMANDSVGGAAGNDPAYVLITVHGGMQ